MVIDAVETSSAALDCYREQAHDSFRYHGKDRLVEPHDHGILNGSVQLLSWQVDGGSSRPLPNWLLTMVNEITDLVLLDQTFPGDGPLPPANMSNGMCCSSESVPPMIPGARVQDRSIVDPVYACEK